MAAPRDRKTEHYEERTTSTIIPATGPIDRSQFSDIIEPVDMMTVNEKIKNLAFMEEPVDVIINESDNPNAEQTIQLLCNGVSQFMIRGQMQTIKRKFLAILATVALAALFGALAVIDWNPLIQNKGAGWTAIAISVVMAVLRTVTTTAPGKSA